MTGKVERIYLAEESRGAVTRVDSAALEENRGIVGDRYHARALASSENGNGAAIKNITLIAREELDSFLANNNSNIDYGDFRRNIITSGIDPNSLLGKKFSIGDVLCIGTELSEPCAFLAATVHPAVLPELVNKGGLRATVLSDGEIETGSEILPA